MADNVNRQVGPDSEVERPAEVGCDIITVTHDLLKKLPLLGRDLTEYSLDTVKMFFEDARAAGLTLNTPVAV